MEHYPVKLELRLDWSEMDLFGHINNVSYFKYVQASRVNYWEVIGIGTMSQTGIGPLLLSTSCRFKQPLFYPGKITIEATVQYIKNTSFGIQHRILNDKGEIAAEAEDVIVMYDFGKNEKIPVPDAMRRKVEEIEGKQYS